MWTKEEMEDYFPRAYEPLMRLYEKNRLSDPEERARFLAEDVLQLGMTDQNLVMRKTAKDGKAAGLNLLEDIVIATHKKDLETREKEIIYPFNELAAY